MSGPENPGNPDPNASQGGQSSGWNQQPSPGQWVPGSQPPTAAGPDATQVSSPGHFPPPAAPGQFGQSHDPNPGQSGSGQFGAPPQGSFPQSAPGQYPQPGGYPQPPTGGFPQPGQYPQPAQHPQPGQYAQPGQYSQPTPYGQPASGQFPQPGYTQPAQSGQLSQPGYPAPSGYAQPGAYSQPGQPYQPFVTDPGHAGQAPQQSGQPTGTDGAFSSMVKPAADRKPRMMLIAAAAIAVIAVALAVTAFLAPGFALQKKLSQGGLQDGVTKILTSAPPEGYQVDSKTLSDVNCPSGQKAKKNATFTCTAKINGNSFTVPITVTNSDGNFQVGRPVAEN
ncbi:DUF4333 domain-containing protein [Jongsikchunia kroppenstedtii]|uniref:DUF4333 domain-containing protein n=1 Tax=Jongsikchunia kroppenstedtii TaxID=1121721 RepID=UPI000364EC39|nr:DUF4333 domain-containing protein [Jongsikchunia kroppenstedtii]